LYKLFEQYNDDGDISYSEESSGKLSDAVKQSVSGVEYAAAVVLTGFIFHSFSPKRYFVNQAVSTTAAAYSTPETDCLTASLNLPEDSSE